MTHLYHYAMPLDDTLLGVTDYMVLALVMLISLCIGLYFTGHTKTAESFLMADRKMTTLPVTFSLVATKMSAITLLGVPAETFLFGTQRLVGVVMYPLGALVAAYVFLPPFYAVNSPTIYAYLECRFGRYTRRIISTLCFIQTYFFLSLILFAPALALDAVTLLSVDTSVVLMGLVTTLFSVMGGMRAVMWADVFQTLCMFATLVAVVAFGFGEAGIGRVYSTAWQGGRMEWFNLSVDVGVRYTFWNSLLLGISPAVVAICISQMEMQRAFAIRELAHAQASFLWSTIPTVAIVFLTNTIGLIMFAIFSQCNPLAPESGTGLKKADQIVPYYIVSRMTGYPGLAGLCVSGLFCGAISSMSSALNSMSTVIIDDFVRPFTPPRILAKLNINILAKVLVVFNGAVVTILPLAIPLQSGVFEGAIIYNAVIYAPVFSVYLLGMLTETANQKGAFTGLVCGVALATWISIGARMTGRVDIPTSLSTYGCPTNFTASYHANESIVQEETYKDDSGFVLHRLSYAWTGIIGITTTFLIGYIASSFINIFQAKRNVESHLLSPVTRFWIKQPPLRESEYPLQLKIED